MLTMIVINGNKKRRRIINLIDDRKKRNYQWCDEILQNAYDPNDMGLPF